MRNALSTALLTFFGEMCRTETHHVFHLHIFFFFLHKWCSETVWLVGKITLTASRILVSSWKPIRVAYSATHLASSTVQLLVERLWYALWYVQTRSWNAGVLTCPELMWTCWCYCRHVYHIHHLRSALLACRHWLHFSKHRCRVAPTQFHKLALIQVKLGVKGV